MDAVCIYLDWCRAQGLEPWPLERSRLDRFACDVPLGETTTRRRRQQITAYAMAQGHPVTQVCSPSPRQVPRVRAARADVPNLPRALRRIEVAGFPGGYRGRRDAWLLVLTQHVQLTRAQAVRVVPTDVIRGGDEPGPAGWTICGVPLDRTPDPITCLRCVTTRWLRVAHDEFAWSRSVVRERMPSTPTEPPPGPISKAAVLEGTGLEGTGHDCIRPLPAGWRNVRVLAPAIDRHGWAGQSGCCGRASGALAPMTPRALTSVLSRRRSDLASSEPPVSPEPQSAAPQRDGVRFDETTFARLDAICARADVLNARVAEAIAPARG